MCCCFIIGTIRRHQNIEYVPEIPLCSVINLVLDWVKIKKITPERSSLRLRTRQCERLQQTSVEIKDLNLDLDHPHNLENLSLTRDTDLEKCSGNLSDPDHNPNLYRNPYHSRNRTNCFLAQDTPLVKITCKSVHYFVSNPTDKQRDKKSTRPKV